MNKTFGQIKGNTRDGERIDGWWVGDTTLKSARKNTLFFMWPGHKARISQKLWPANQTKATQAKKTTQHREIMENFKCIFEYFRGQVCVGVFENI